VPGPTVRMHILTLAAMVACVASAPFEVQKEQTDANVASLTALKPRPVKKWNLEPTGRGGKMESSGGLVQQLQKIKQDVGGHRYETKQSINEVTKNGHVVSSLAHAMDSRSGPGEKPHTSSMTEVEIPSLGIHERITSRDDESEKIADPETAAKLAGYVMETGDQGSVVQFLQLLLQEGKMSEEQALAYVETIKKDIELAEERMREKEKENEMESETRERERERERLPPRDDLDKIRKLVEAEERAQEERVALEKARSLKEATDSLEKDESEHDIILRINDYLESSLKEGKITKNLYNHLKEALIESVVESLRTDAGGLPSMDYLHY